MFPTACRGSLIQRIAATIGVAREGRSVCIARGGRAGRATASPAAARETRAVRGLPRRRPGFAELRHRRQGLEREAAKLLGKIAASHA